MYIFIYLFNFIYGEHNISVSPYSTTSYNFVTKGNITISLKKQLYHIFLMLDGTLLIIVTKLVAFHSNPQSTVQSY